MRVAECVTELGRWDEAERASDPRLRPYVHGYFATSSSLVGLARHRHLPTPEVPLVLNFGAPHTRLESRADSSPQSLDDAWVTGLQTRYHLSDADGERRFMVVRFTPLGAHLFFRLPMVSLADKTVPLDQIDPGIASLVSSRVMIAGSWADRFDAMENLIGSRVAASALPTGLQVAWDTLARTHGQTAAGSLSAAAGCSHRHLIRQFRTCIGLPPKRAAMLLRFSRSLDEIAHCQPTGSSRKPYLEKPAASAASGPRVRWADVATGCGYFDQSHFVREFSAFAGATPSEFLRTSTWPPT